MTRKKRKRRPKERGKVLTRETIERLLREAQPGVDELAKTLDRMYDIPPEIWFMRLRSA